MFNYYLKVKIDKEFSLIYKYDINVNRIIIDINVNKSKDNMKFIDLKDLRSLSLIEKKNKKNDLKDEIDNKDLDDFKLIINLDSIKKKFKYKKRFNRFSIMNENRFNIIKLMKDLDIKLNYSKERIIDKIYSYNRLDIKVVKKVRRYEDIIKDKFSKKYDLRLVMNNSKKFSESEEFLSYKKDLNLELII